MTPDQKTHIDSLSVEQLLATQRNAPLGSQLFAGEVGTYRMKRLAELRAADNDAYVAASKRIGH